MFCYVWLSFGHLYMLQVLGYHLGSFRKKINSGNYCLFLSCSVFGFWHRGMSNLKARGTKGCCAVNSFFKQVWCPPLSKKQGFMCPRVPAVASQGAVGPKATYPATERKIKSTARVEKAISRILNKQLKILKALLDGIACNNLQCFIYRSMCCPQCKKQTERLDLQPRGTRAYRICWVIDSRVPCTSAIRTSLVPPAVRFAYAASTKLLIQ